MSVGSRLVGYLVLKKSKFNIRFNGDNSLEIEPSETNENLTEDGVYKYVVHEGDMVEVYGTFGFMSSREKMESEKRKLEGISYTVSSMRP
jgi:hypothetical protein